MLYCSCEGEPHGMEMSSVRKRNNLEGWVRDMRDAINNEDLGVLASVLEVIDDADALLEDPEDSPVGESESDVGLPDAVDGEGVGTAATGHDTVRSAPLVGPTRVDPEMVDRVQRLARDGARGTAQPLGGARGRRLVSGGA